MGNRVTGCGLADAAALGDDEAVRCKLEELEAQSAHTPKGPDAYRAVTAIEEERSEALVLAAYGGHAGCVRLLLDAGVSADAAVACDAEWSASSGDGALLSNSAAGVARRTDTAHATPATAAPREVPCAMTSAAYAAASSGSTDVLLLLFHRGATFTNARGPLGGSLLHVAACCQPPEAPSTARAERIKQLHRRFTRISRARAKVGAPAGKKAPAKVLPAASIVETERAAMISRAALADKAGRAAVVLLLELGAATHVDVRDEHGYTALHRAAEAGRPRTIATLLEYGADPLALVEGNGDSAAHSDETENPNVGCTALQLVAVCQEPGADAACTMLFKAQRQAVRPPKEIMEQEEERAELVASLKRIDTRKRLLDDLPRSESSKG